MHGYVQKIDEKIIVLHLIILIGNKKGDHSNVYSHDLIDGSFAIFSVSVD